MTGTLRTPTGGRIDRTRTIAFRFDGRRLAGHPGDTLASALLANGVRVVARSFKYHRPRGILAAGAEEPNALVTVARDPARTTPNLRATQVELYDGLVAHSQNRWPSLAVDVGAVNDWFAPLLVAGFYYKTFKWPTVAWARLYEPLIRAAAGHGRAPRAPDPDRYLPRYAHCDVLVVGAGPAGLAAALAASRAGARVILADEQAEFGGSLLAEPQAQFEGVPAWDWIEAAVRELRAGGRVRLLPRTTAFGAFHDNFVALAERVTDHLADPDPALPRERLWQVRAAQVVIATGAIERPLVFPGNDRPGILLAGAARTYLTRYGVKAGRRAVVVTATDAAYAVARDLAAAGVEVAAVLDLRGEPGPAAAEARGKGLRVETAATVCGTAGRRQVRSVTVGRVRDGQARAGETIACDLVLMSGGFTPAVHLVSQARGRLVFDAARQAFLPGELAPNQHVAGAVRGTFELAACLDEGFVAGEAAARAAGHGGAAAPRPIVARGAAAVGGGHLGVCPQPGGTVPARAFVDFQNDVTVKDIRLATQEGFRSIEHIKRYTTTGMATDQGKTSNLNALAIAADALGRSLPEVGLTTFRMPYTPVTFGTLAGTGRGALFDPLRRTPIHGWAAARGAVFEDVGLWSRARFFPRAGEDMHAAVARECRTVRTACGVFDASTLGKIEVVGRDAAGFLERMYVNAFARLAPGRCRYGLLLNEAGFIIDDGVIGRLAPDRFHVTTTTGGAPRVLALMEDYRQTEWPDLEVWLTSTTEQWAVIAVQGPRAREVIAPLIEGLDLSPEALPHMAMADGAIAGVPARLFRVSFTGELGFEINVPAGYGADVWERVSARAEQLGGCAYGTETMHVLRAEKGYVIVGQETDGTVTPDDAGLAWAIGKSKRDFVGKRSLQRPDIVAAGRKQLVGLLTENPAAVLEEGAQITAEASPRTGSPALGHVTSSYWSAALGRSIALALVADGRARMGARLHVPMPGGAIPVGVTGPVFYDPKGERLHG